MKWLKSLFGKKSNKKNNSSKLRFDKNKCQHCGSENFTYDSYWNEFICQNCGYIVESKKLKKYLASTSIFKNESINKKNMSTKDSNLFSYSRISLFNKCQKAYYFKYIEQKDEQFLTVEQHLGISIHKAIENSYLLKDKYQSLLSYRDVENLYQSAWNGKDFNKIKIIKCNLTLNDYYKFGLTMIKSFYERIYKNDNNNTIALEKYFEINLDKNIKYCGRIDRIARSVDGLLNIVDFKTGKHVQNPRTDLQLRSYALWAFQEYEDNVIEIGYHAIKLHEYKNTTIKRKAASRVKERLYSEIEVIKAAEEYRPSPSFLCKWCGYNPICGEFRI